MSNAARLASVCFSGKPAGLPYSAYFPSVQSVAQIRTELSNAFLDASFSAAASFAEAISGLNQNAFSWSIVRFYYSSFYSLRALLLSRGVVPFNCAGEYYFDTASQKFFKGGRSSHHWNWKSLRAVPSLRGAWFRSEDASEAYDKLRSFRENVNYTHAFTDPDLHHCLVSPIDDLGRRYRAYRDDANFELVYLDDHVVFAFPTRLLAELEGLFLLNSFRFPDAKRSHLSRIWPLRDRCPLAV